MWVLLGVVKGASAPGVRRPPGVIGEWWPGGLDRLPDYDIPTYWLTWIITVIPLGHRPLRARVRRSEGDHAPDEWPTAA